MARKNKAKRQVMDRSKYKQKQEEQQAKRKGRSIINLPEGIERLKITKKGVKHLDLIPYEVTDPKHPGADVGDLYYCRPYRVHRNIGQNNQQIVCPSTFGDPCPICIEKAKLKADEESDEKTIKSLNSSERGLYVLQDRADEDDILYVFEAGFWAKGGTPGFGMMLENEISYQDEDDQLPWDWTGPSLKIRFSVDTYKKNEFYPVEKLDLNDEGKDVDPDIMDDVPNLDDCLVRLSYEVIEKIFLGQGDGDEEDEDDTPQDKRSAKKPVKKPAKKPVKKIEEEEEEEELDDDEKKELIDHIKDFDPDDIDFDDADEVREAREGLLEAAENLDIDTSGIPKQITGKNNDTERGLIKLQKAIVKLMGAPSKTNKKAAEDKKENLTKNAKAAKAAKKAAREAKKAEKAGNECPYDHTFGTDWEEHKECDGCEVEDACGDAE